MVSSEDRAQTMAEYLQEVQWAVRPCLAASTRRPIGGSLPINVGPITHGEVEEVVKKQRCGRVCGEDQIPAEFWRAVFAENTAGSRWLVDLCQQCWEGRCMPHEWQVSRVACIFKKGDLAECFNYRPISLLSAGYKIFAAVLLNRLRDGGAEDRIWPTQFGFRRRHGTEHA